jgi:hypothetical protein
MKLIRGGIVVLFAVRMLATTHAGVLPNHAVVDGRTIGEWTAEWWKWVYSIPTSQNPMLDQTGEYANVEQPDAEVFFIAGVPGLSADPVTRTFTVPEGKYLLVPVLMVQGDNIDTEPPFSIAELRDLVAAVISNPRELHASIDGLNVTNLAEHRVPSPLFSLVIESADNLKSFTLGHPFTGLIDPIVADGYWLMLEPLPPGPHILHFGGSYSNELWFPNDITAQIEVVPTSIGDRVTELISWLDQSQLPSRTKHAVIVSLNAAADSFQSGSLRAGINQLHAFQNKVRAQLGRCDQTLADDLIEAAQQIIDRATRELE